MYNISTCRIALRNRGGWGGRAQNAQILSLWGDSKYSSKDGVKRRGNQTYSKSVVATINLNYKTFITRNKLAYNNNNNKNNNCINNNGNNYSNKVYNCLGKCQVHIIIIIK